MKVLAVSETSYQKNDEDFLINKMKDRCDLDVIYTKNDGEKLTYQYRVLRKLGFEQDLGQINERLIKKVSEKRYDVIFLVKANRVKTKTIQFIKRINPDTKIFGWSGDNMTKLHNATWSFKRSICLYDHFFSVNIASYKSIANVSGPKFTFLDKCADDHAHVFRAHQKTIDPDILFIGSYEKERATILNYLARRGYVVNVYGARWTKCKIKLSGNIIIHYRELKGEEYSNAIYSAKITLGFLRKQNDDTQTSRSFEIPGCKGFMLMERTDDHQRLFKEGQEAEFFSSKFELLKKVCYYLANDRKRKSVAENGFKRVVKGKYLYSELAKKICLAMAVEK
jgi:spore maturation protein CgeB